MQILLVDDDAFSRKLMGYYLKPMGAEVETAESGEQCLELVSQRPPSLILMDCQMPGLDGFETVLRLRSSGFSGLILALTGNSDEETLRRCSEVGMQGHLSKPVDPARLREVIQQHLGQSLEAAVAPADSSPAGGDPLARARSIAEAARNPGLLQRLVSAFIKNTDEVMLQFDSAHQSGDQEAASALAHKLRGSAGTFGAAAMAELAGQLEERLQRESLESCATLVQQLQGLWPNLRLQLEHHGGSP